MRAEQNAKRKAYLFGYLYLAMFSLEGLAHAEGDTAFVQRLVRRDGHSDLIAHTQQQQAALGAADGDLSDQLVKDLRV